MLDEKKLSEQVMALSHGHFDSPEEMESTKLKQMDEVYDKAGAYGRYQIAQFIIMIILSVSGASNSAGGYLSLGSTKPTYICNDDNFTLVQIKHNETYVNAEIQKREDGCFILKNCVNISIETKFHSVYESFEWVCEPEHLPTTVASISPFISMFGYIVGGHISDYFGRRFMTLACMTSLAILIYCAALAQNHYVYFVIMLLEGFSYTLRSGPSYALYQESTSSKYRLLHGFAFHWTLGYIVAGILAYTTRSWRYLLVASNTFAIPAVIAAIFIFQESPRWLLSKKRYEDAANALNRMAKINKKDKRFTAEELTHVEILSDDKKRHFNTLHLFCTCRLALYSITQILVGCVQNLVYMVILMGINDLAGSPFLNISLFGILRLWTPFFVVALEYKYKWFGRRALLLGSLGGVFMCFAIMSVINLIGLWQRLHVLATCLGLIGYAINFGIVWNAYKQYTAELFPTEMRSIALSSFSLITMMGTAAAPQLIYLKKYYFAMPYMGAAGLALIAWLFAFAVLPETRGRPMWDTLDEMLLEESKRSLDKKKRRQSIMS